jgi:hypothetical protein
MAGGEPAVSEHSVTVLRLDGVSAAEGQELTDGVRELLLTSGVIAVNDRRDPLWQRSEWMPGPAAYTALAESVDWFYAFLATANNGVDIRNDRDVYHPVENDEPPRCPGCGAVAPQRYVDSYRDWLEQWMSDAREPRFTCDVCGWHGLVGDWSGQFSVLIGGPAVRFLNWPPLSSRLIADIRASLGGRTGVVASHW